MQTFGASAGLLLGREGSRALVSVLPFAPSLTSATDCLKKDGGFTVIRCVVDRTAPRCKARAAGLAAHYMNMVTAKFSIRADITYADPVLWPIRWRVSQNRVVRSDRASLHALIPLLLFCNSFASIIDADIHVWSQR